ncbi:uncharacterized protein G2W53_017557 [Senna tora]|uniref:Uncharacterized protein n=1 Tax=Senna tora TaxID=362788 RepID=A0A834TPF8_9FABA|nr:uncharacterized protein G2W53_017557 [Senna tora]
MHILVLVDELGGFVGGPPIHDGSYPRTGFLDLLNGVLVSYLVLLMWNLCINRFWVLSKTLVGARRVANQLWIGRLCARLMVGSSFLPPRLLFWGMS